MRASPAATECSKETLKSDTAIDPQCSDIFLLTKCSRDNLVSRSIITYGQRELNSFPPVNQESSKQGEEVRRDVLDQCEIPLATIS